MEKKTAFIGGGNMGGAIIRGALSVLAPEQIIVTRSNFENARKLADELGCTAMRSNGEAAWAANLILLCVKPSILPAVLREITPALRSGQERGNPKLLCSIAAGVSIAEIREMLDMADYPVVRAMPNTPALVGKGLTLLAAGETAVDCEMGPLRRIFQSCGTVSDIPEKLMDSATPVSGCAPAFAYMFIEALADGGVMLGLSRKDALEFSARAVMGAAAMVLETGAHPGALKDMVCSPGGSTIAGVAALEEKGFRGAVIDAALASSRKPVK